MVQNGRLEELPGQELQTRDTAGTGLERPQKRTQSHAMPLLHWDPGSLALWHRVRVARSSFPRRVQCLHVRVHLLICVHVQTSDMLLYQSHVSGINLHLIF